MTREREIFLQALEQPVEARSAFVERATAGDPKLKEAVEALLANNQADTFLEQGVAGLLRESMEAEGSLTAGEERIFRQRQSATGWLSSPTLMAFCTASMSRPESHIGLSTSNLRSGDLRCWRMARFTWAMRMGTLQFSGQIRSWRSRP